MSFVKIHGSILHSSIWAESHQTRIVWITMLAMADEHGVVEASVGGLARAAVVSLKECREALKVLLGPDPDSRDGTTGERLEKVPGGWLILNHAEYRDRQTRSQALTAARVRKHRERKRDERNRNDVTEHLGISPSEAEAEAEKKKKTRARATPLPDIPEGLQTPEFEAAWEAWVAHRSEIKKALTPRAAQMALKKLAAWGPEKAILAIEAAIVGRWSGLFEPDAAKVGAQGFLGGGRYPQPAARGLTDEEPDWQFEAKLDKLRAAEEPVYTDGSGAPIANDVMAERLVTARKARRSG